MRETNPKSQANEFNWKSASGLSFPSPGQHLSIWPVWLPLPEAPEKQAMQATHTSGQQNFSQYQENSGKE